MIKIMTAVLSMHAEQVATCVCLYVDVYGCRVEQVLDITREMVTHARSHVEDVEFSAEDALRSNHDFLSEVK